MPLSDFIKRDEAKFSYYVFREIEELGFLKHWVTTRRHSADGTGDNDMRSVPGNRERVSRALCAGRPVYLPEQVHGNDVLEIAHEGQECRKADGLVISKPGVPLGVLTADCLPVILADPERKAAGIIHAGRMGVFQKIIPIAIEKITRLYGSNPANMLAGMGPAIRKCCYRVGEEVFNGYEDFRKYGDDNGMLDMQSAAERQMVEAGLSPGSIFDSGICTSCRADEFFSHRKEMGKAGRFMTGIMITEPDPSPYPARS